MGSKGYSGRNLHASIIFSEQICTWLHVYKTGCLSKCKIVQHQLGTISILQIIHLLCYSRYRLEQQCYYIQSIFSTLVKFLNLTIARLAKWFRNLIVWHDIRTHVMSSHAQKWQEFYLSGMLMLYEFYYKMSKCITIVMR